MKKSTDDKLTLNVQKRLLSGKKAHKLRRDGLVLANIFGPEFKSQSVSVNLKDLLKTYKTAKETGVVYIDLDKQEIPVLIKNIQRHPVSDMILHVDFRKIDLKKKIETAVPVKTIGASEAVSQKGGVLLMQTDSILVEAFPQDIPQQIEVDISVIKELGQEVKVSDLKKSDKYEVKTPSEKVIVSVVEHKEESVTPDTTAAAPEVIEVAPKEGEETPVTSAPEATKGETKGEAKAKPEAAKSETPSPKK